MTSKLSHKLVLLSFTICIFLTNCETRTEVSSNEQKIPENTYLNHSDSARYVGMNTCKLCHQGIYNTFINTGMGKSFDIATKLKSSGDFKNATFFDKENDLHYKAFWDKDSLYIKEFRIGNDTTCLRTEQVNYIIGSGQHTNSHIQNVNGYLNQMPMTFYTQKRKWDLPPGFENGMNTHFTRKIGLECMSCHNGYPDFVMGSENKYKFVPSGIDCERCHGPGSIHVNQKQIGIKVDTSKQIDYSIVNPSKLSIDLQFDICQRCHLQGNAVLKNGHSFYDFKPGQKLSDHISVFLPKYKSADDEFIMASHADRLKQSACFIKSIEKQKTKNQLKPYKGAMTCITCHNPHVSVREINKNIFNDACKGCHGSGQLAVSPSEICKTNCVNCHMPSSGSIDIPHVTVHDHYIRKPITKKEKDKIKEFIGLYAINEKDPSDKTKARAYIQQYEKFEQNKNYLDSAKKYLSTKTKEDIKNNLHDLIQLSFMTQDFKQILKYLVSIGEDNCYKQLMNLSYDNKDAWASYHIAEAFYYTDQKKKSLTWFEKACKLANYNLDFKIKFGAVLAQSNLPKEAEQQFLFVIKENPKKASGYTNLGYLKLLQGKGNEALANYNKALALEPDSEPALLNLAGYYVSANNKLKALEIIKQILNKNPKNLQAQQALKQLQNVSL
ncbi:MAG: tetratricopeptide repeat protein [Bacteroidota bacterium]|nr:tetratricopeptide repeat protein [Bacteroidota bacterium]